MSELKEFDLTTKAKLIVDAPPSELADEVVRRGEGSRLKRGSLLVLTGKYTGRLPKAKFIVRDSETENKVHWGSINQGLDNDSYQNLKAKIKAYLSAKDVLFVKKCRVGADKKFSLGVNVLTESAVGALFSDNMFLDLDGEKIPQDKVFTLYHAPGCLGDPVKDGLQSEAFVILNFSERVILIGGTGYCGEIKKSVFSIMNYLMPESGILPMHSSANMALDGTNAALFFGLSGTGKTTLSAASDRKLIGDDEHGWSDEGVFNFEGGCYAKVIRLSEKDEPEIYGTTKKPLTILENVILGDNQEPDFNNDSITENIRASYPIEYIPNMSEKGTGGHPQHVIMLTCDAFGVLPPVAKLNPAQAAYHFLAGYTAKIAGTEEGIKEPQATFSHCFGAPFMPLVPAVYARMLSEKIEKYGSHVWLINTGWSGGVYGVGERMKLSYTRAIVNAALSGKLSEEKTWTDPIFKFQVPERCDGVPDTLLNPKTTWNDPEKYDLMAKNLAAMFEENFVNVSLNVPPEVLAAGPALS